MNKEFIEYVKSKKYEPVDITEHINAKNYWYFANELKKMAKKLMYFKRNVYSEPIFNIIEKGSDTKQHAQYIIMNSESSVAFNIDEKLSSVTKFVINQMTLDETVCNVCLDKNIKYLLCWNCAYRICTLCNDNLVKAGHTKCPHCRELL